MTTINRATALLATAAMAFSMVPVAQAGSPPELESTTIHARTIEEVRTVRVPYGDLDVNGNAGIKTLVSRIKIAVRQVCPMPDLRYQDARKSARVCEEQALSNAMAQVDELIAERELARR